MIRLSRKVEYAIIALLHLAENAQEEPVSAREIIEKYHLPSELVGKILQKLGKADLIESVQGVKGGYILKKPLEDISLKEVIDVIDGSVRLTRCSTRSDRFCSCHQLKDCNIKNAIYYLQREIDDYFRSIRLDRFYQMSVIS